MSGFSGFFVRNWQFTLVMTLLFAALAAGFALRWRRSESARPRDAFLDANTFAKNRAAMQVKDGELAAKRAKVAEIVLRPTARIRCSPPS